ncbi:murein hydrolase activator EnvC family protein [Paenisporosarcina antarctica]|uniref:Peptidase M23 n=1 Tax=Paenisporosarcina antarctica TaxID=417367 RepID=A0A4V1AN70_9BACL|nr:M23 family metallopeptidase [Paenisporosarcina antarctica]QBP41745.1 peptidase M23 [Paenisporosarcina antarctica]
MRKKQSKFLLVTIVTVLGCSIFMTQPTALANSLNNLQNEHKQLEEKKNQLNSSIIQKKGDISQNQTNQEKIHAQIQTLDNKINETNSEVDSLLVDIKRTNREIDELHESINVLEKKIAERDELIKERLRAVQESGGSVNYLDVLLGASSFTDFIDRFSAVNTLMDADQKIIEEQAIDVNSLDEKKGLVEEKLTKQQQSRDDLLNLKASLNSQKVSKDKLVDQLEKEQATFKQEKTELEDEHNHVYEISKNVEGKIVVEQARIIEVARQAEIARKKKEAEERERLEEAEQARQKEAEQSRQKTASNKSSKTSVAAPVVTPAPVVSSGNWTRPAAGRFSSTYGGRNIGSGNEFHYGSDIANSPGTPILSAADGVVSYAAPMGTYGNVIMVTHSIDGQIFTTVYAHLNGFNVSSGQAVSKGQVIGKMGSTGRSTGPHLHFEVHVGPWNGARSNAVNPIRYVSF